MCRAATCSGAGSGCGGRTGPDSHVQPTAAATPSSSGYASTSGGGTHGEAPSHRITFSITPSRTIAYRISSSTTGNRLRPPRGPRPRRPQPRCRLHSRRHHPHHHQTPCRRRHQRLPPSRRRRSGRHRRRRNRQNPSGLRWILRCPPLSPLRGQPVPTGRDRRSPRSRPECRAVRRYPSRESRPCRRVRRRRSPGALVSVTASLLLLTPSMQRRVAFTRLRLWRPGWVRRERNDPNRAAPTRVVCA